MIEFLATLDDETRAFLHIAGVRFHLDPRGRALPFIVVGKIDWAVYMPPGDIHTLEYWKAAIAAEYKWIHVPIVPGN